MRGKIIITLQLLLVLTNIEASDDLESIYRRFIEFQKAGKYEAALDEGTEILCRLDVHEEMLLDVEMGHLFFFDQGMVLIALSRWAEAKYCFTRCIIGNNPDKELQTVFGEGFSRKKWMKANRLEDQLFFKSKSEKQQAHNTGAAAN